MLGGVWPRSDKDAPANRDGTLHGSEAAAETDSGTGGIGAMMSKIGWGGKTAAAAEGPPAEGEGQSRAKRGMLAGWGWGDRSAGAAEAGGAEPAGGAVAASASTKEEKEAAAKALRPTD